MGASERTKKRQGFVDAIRPVFYDAAVTDAVSLFLRPPRGKTSEDLIDLSVWFNDLAIQDRQNVEKVIEMAVRAAVFGFLCVLDGARAIENGPMKGRLDLRYRGGSEDISLNDDEGDPLHDLL